MSTVSNVHTESLGGHRLRQRLRSNLLGIAASEGIGRGSLLLANLYLARSLGVERFGLFSLAQTLVLCFWMAADFGTGIYGVREIAKDKPGAPQLIRSLLSMRLVFSIAVFVLYLGAIQLIDVSADEQKILLPCGLYLITFSLYPDWIFKGFENFALISLGSLAVAAVYLGGSVCFVHHPEDAGKAALLWSTSYLVAAALMFVVLYRKHGIGIGLSMAPREWMSHGRSSFFFATSGCLLLLYHYLPILILRICSSNHEVGIFFAPFRIILTIGAASFLIPSSFYPVLSELFHADRYKFETTRRKLYVMMMFLGLPIGVVGYLLSDRVVGLALGEQYSASIGIFAIIVWLVPLYFVRNAIRIALLAGNKQRWLSFSLLVGVLVTVAIGPWLISQQGAAGCAITLLTAEIATIATSSVFAFSKSPAPAPPKWIEPHT